METFCQKRCILFAFLNLAGDGLTICSGTSSYSSEMNEISETTKGCSLVTSYYLEGWYKQNGRPLVPAVSLWKSY